MKIYIATCALGSFAFDENKKLVAYKLFPLDAKIVAEKLNSNQTIEEENQIIETLKRKGFGEFLLKPEKAESGKDLIPDADNTGESILKENFRELASKFVKSQSDLNKLLMEVSLHATKAKLQKTGMDKIAMQTIGMIDDLDKILNLFVERLREWYGMYFPEINDLVKNHEGFLEFVANKTKREFFEKDGTKLRFESAGMELADEDLQEIKETAKDVYELYQRRKKLETYLKKTMETIAPNASALAGADLAARLVAKAGGLDKLAKMPSSTIQLLGSEKALFRFLKGQGKSPKHGIIFFHPSIINSPIPVRGKIARLLASKIAIAARVDCYSKEYKGTKLKEEFEGSLNRIIEDFKRSKN